MLYSAPDSFLHLASNLPKPKEQVHVSLGHEAQTSGDYSGSYASKHPSPGKWSDLGDPEVTGSTKVPDLQRTFLGFFILRPAMFTCCME